MRDIQVDATRPSKLPTASSDPLLKVAAFLPHPAQSAIVAMVAEVLRAVSRRRYGGGYTRTPVYGTGASKYAHTYAVQFRRASSLVCCSTSADSHVRPRQSAANNRQHACPPHHHHHCSTAHCSAAHCPLRVRGGQLEVERGDEGEREARGSEGECV